MLITLRGKRKLSKKVYLSIVRLLFCLQGFAFINFVHREDAARTIQSVQEFGYYHLILSEEWAK